jgi:hypothetical protein
MTVTLIQSLFITVIMKFESCVVKACFHETQEGLVLSIVVLVVLSLVVPWAANELPVFPNQFSSFVGFLLSFQLHL